MVGINPFAKRAEEFTPIKKSGFERLHPQYRVVCERIAQNSGRISPQNRRVREAADKYCLKNGIPIR